MENYKKITEKIIGSDLLINQVKQWQQQGEKVVFTNGCFDILHRGHVTYLSKAADAGDRLVIGLNSDDSVKRQGKGENRPVNDQDSRALVLAALGFVDAVVLFSGDTPLELIEKISPDVLVKGGDYDADEKNPSDKKYIVGSDVIKSRGGKVITIPLVEGFSTTSTIEKMKKQ